MRHLTLIMICLVAGCAASAQDLVYDESAGGKDSRLNLRILWSAARDRCDLRMEHPGNDLWEFVLDGKGATKSCHVQRAGGEGISLVRIADTIEMETSSGEKKDKKSLAIDGAPWYESMEVGLSRFAMSGVQREDFWAIDVDRRKATKMSAKRAGMETIDCSGSRFTAVRVLVTAAGVPALFYGVTYWFRQSDGLYLRFEGVRGGPGTPKTIVVYKGEE
jgi:hypothetical protein